MIRVHLRNFFILKICNFITIRFYFSFEKILVVAKFAIKIFFNISAKFIANGIIFFELVIIFNQEIH